MTQFERQAYANMRSIDRIWLYMVKVMELVELSRIMTEEDVQGLKRIFKLMQE